MFVRLKYYTYLTSLETAQTCRKLEAIVKNMCGSSLSGYLHMETQQWFIGE